MLRQLFKVLFFVHSFIVLISCSGINSDKKSTEVVTPDSYLIFNSCLSTSCNTGFRMYFHNLKTNTTDFKDTNFFNPNYIIDQSKDNNQVYFSIEDISGTTISKFDISFPFNSITNPAPVFQDSLSPTFNSPRDFIVFDTKIFFSASSSAYGRELVVFDTALPQSPTNPSLVKDINPGNLSSNPKNFTHINSKLYFRAATSAEGEELWVYDTNLPIDTNNPRLTADIYSGPTTSDPEPLIVIENKLFFCADNNTNGIELWVLDSNLPLSSSNPSITFDLAPGGPDGCRSQPVAYKNKIYFNGNSGNNDYELGVYDSSLPSSPTNPSIIDLNPGLSSSSSPSDLLVYKNYLIFSALSSNSTPQPVIYNLEKGLTSSNPKRLNINLDINFNPQMFSVANNFLYFSAFTSSTGHEPWVFNLSKSINSTNPKLIKDLEPGTTESNPENLTAVSPKSLFFTAETTSDGIELYKYTNGNSEPELFRTLTGFDVIRPQDLFVF
jgi:ELWxxDGT repeat protein